MSDRDGWGIYGDNISHYWLDDDGMVAQPHPARAADKTPYRVPTMAEIAAVPPNGYNVVSLFSGAGGSCCGLRMAGFKVLWASEFVPAARDTYRANWPDTVLDERDIRDVKPSDILRATGLERGQLDLLEGSPPCASFSTAGRRHKTWGKIKSYSDTAQRSDDLFFEYARIVDGLQPKVFTAENVSGLVKGVAKGYFLEILARLKACGYDVRARLLDAQWLGVPQMRQRVFFVGVRSDLGLEPAFPEPLPYRYSVRDALPHIMRHGTASISHDGWVASGKDVERLMEESDRAPAPTVTVVQVDKAKYVVDASPARVVHDTSGQHSQGDVTDRPCPAVTVGVDSLNSRHYQVEQQAGTATERRRFTIDELKAICSFPPDYILTGSYGQAWERCGRAVPPLMMKALADALRERVFDRLPPHA